MKRELQIAGALVLAMFVGVANGVAGDHFHFHGHRVGYAAPVIYGSPVVYAAPVAYAAPVMYSAPVAYPVAYAAPAVAYQPAYVVPPVGGVGYAPLVPAYSTVGYYYAPRAAYVAPVSLHRRHFHGYRPRDIEIELEFKRHGGFEYEVDFD